jgi:hypothetical protein
MIPQSSINLPLQMMWLPKHYKAVILAFTLPCLSTEVLFHFSKQVIIASRKVQAGGVGGGGWKQNILGVTSSESALSHGHCWVGIVMEKDYSLCEEAEDSFCLYSVVQS